MYRLEDGTEWNDTIKNAFKRNLTRAYIKVGNTIISQDNYLMNVKYKDEKADPENGNFIGITSMRELTIKLNNQDNQFNLENQEIEYHLGALVGNEYKYINFGKFIVQKPENEEVNEEMTFTALDYMSKFDSDEEYSPTIPFPTTLGALAQDICNQAEVELATPNFRNANMPIAGNPFINGENKRTVLKSIAKLSFSCCYIGQDNKLYFSFDPSSSEFETVYGTNEIEVEIEKEQTADNYIIIGDYYQASVPSVINPVAIQGVGDLVESGIHSGEYLINITNGQNSYDIYITSPLFGIFDYADTLDYSSGTITRHIGVIESYNGETITTPYISSTGELSEGATVIYVLDKLEHDFIITEDSNFLITEDEEFIVI